MSARASASSTGVCAAAALLGLLRSLPLHASVGFEKLLERDPLRLVLDALQRGPRSGASFDRRVGPGLEEDLSCLQIPALCRVVKRRPAVLGDPKGGSRAELEESPDGSGVATGKRSHVEGRVAEGMMRDVRICTRLDQGAYGVYLTIPSSLVDRLPLVTVLCVHSCSAGQGIAKTRQVSTLCGREQASLGYRRLNVRGLLPGGRPLRSLLLRCHDRNVDRLSAPLESSREKRRPRENGRARI